MKGDLREDEIAAVIEGSWAVGPRWTGSLVLADPMHIDKDVQSYAEPAATNTIPRSQMTRPMSIPGDVSWLPRERKRATINENALLGVCVG
jgi:hypothetical protein